MFRRLLILLFLLGVCSIPVSARQRVYGYCYQQINGVPGPQQVSTQCTVTVFVTGTTVKPNLYSDNIGTVLSNSFQSDTNGFWFFYPDNGRYDIQYSGGNPGINPYTTADVVVDDPSLSQFPSCTVTFTPVPVFAAGNCSIFTMTLTGNVISSTIVGGSTGQIIYFNLIQGIGGPWLFVWPTNFLNPPLLTPITSQNEQFSFILLADNKWHSLGTGESSVYDTAVNGNVLRINGNTVNAVTGTGPTVVLQTSPTINTPTVTSPTSTGTDAGTETLTNKTLASPTSTGTDTGTETLTNKTLTAPAITSPVVTGTESGTRTDSGAISFAGNNSHAGAETFSGVTPTFSVTTTGSDSNPCTVASPCLTIQHAASVAMSYVLAGTNATINIGTGTFQGPTLSGFLMGNAGPNINTAFLVLNGNGAANTTINDTMSHTYVINVSGGMQVEIQNMNISVPANETGLFVQLPGSFVIVTGTTTFTGAASSSIAIHAEDFSAISLQGTATITTNGSFNYFASLGFNGQLGVTSTVTINCGTVSAFNTTFAFLDGNSSALFNNTWSGCGALTGTQYSIGGNSYISNTSGSHLPGSTAGQVYAGGRYRPSPTIVASESDGHLGVGASVTVAAGSGSHGGLLTLNTGSSGTSATGLVSFSWSELQIMTAGAVPVPCTAVPQSGAAAWNAQAVMQIAINSLGGGLQIQWSNNAVNLTTGTSYAIAYTCSGDI